LPRPTLLLVLTEFPPSFGGMQTHAVYLCRHLHERGYRFEVATYRADEAAGVDAALPYPVHRSLSRIGYWRNLEALRSLARRIRPDLIYSSTVFYGQAGAATGAPALCRSAGNDVLRPWIAWPYRAASGLLSTPWLETQLYQRYRRLEWPERIENLLIERRRSLMRESALGMRRVLANSEFTAGLLDGIGVAPGRVRVLAGGVDAARFAPAGGDRGRWRERLGLPLRAYLLLTACRLVPKKGIEMLLDAFVRLRARMPDAHLAIAGEGRWRARYEAHAAALGLAGHVTFAGRVAHARLHEYYWAADQFVLASREHVDPRTGLRDVETMGRVLCEANAAGAPVVAARSGGIPSVIRDGCNGLLFEPDDAVALAACVERVRDDPRLAARLRECGLRRAADAFDWSVVCGAHEEEFLAAV
jgi:glycosyltransferase involved in cell wall biosynthesis